MLHNFNYYSVKAVSVKFERFDSEMISINLTYFFALKVHNVSKILVTTKNVPGTTSTESTNFELLNQSFPRVWVKSKHDNGCNGTTRLFEMARIESVQDFLIKLDIKLLIHLLEISTFSLNNVIVRLTKIMNRADKN